MVVTNDKSRVEILGADGNPIRREMQRDRLASQYRQLRARYDAAVTDNLNRNHWANADLLSARAATNPNVRRRVRSRARYECLENNSFARGMILTMSNDVVGTGPNLRVEHSNRPAAQKLEANFRRWMRRVQLASTLRTAISSTVVDGEIYGVAATNPNVRNNVQLDVKLLEADYCTDTEFWQTDRREDGIEYDAAGYPVAYHFLEHHPGDTYPNGQLFKTKRLEADQVMHYFRKDRPGQRRGISWIVSALPLFALLRRYTLATCHAAETASNFAGVMFSKPDAVDGPEEVEAGDLIELTMRMMVTLPQGWELKQLEATQPTTTYKMFRDAVLCEIARCLNMPFNNGDQEAFFYETTHSNESTFNLRQASPIAN
ncbi:phage portal protein [Bremerella sp. JC817]|uniref:phage portal protein n=1 Tax=Bremerella sp. JC817 TaxID=3231756 RepID=UPI003459A608